MEKSRLESDAKASNVIAEGWLLLFVIRDGWEFELPAGLAGDEAHSWLMEKAGARVLIDPKVFTGLYLLEKRCTSSAPLPPH